MARGCGAVLYIGPLPWDPDPAMALRGRSNLAFRVKDGWARWKCPYCGARVKAKLRPGRAKVLNLRHRPWCPVATDGELASRIGGR